MKNLMRKVKGTLMMSVCLAFPFVMSAQGQTQNPAQPFKTNIWYFGDHAGLDFSNGAPVPLVNGAMQAFEGTASMSDPTGNLLFYTNGGDLPYPGGVWNRNHQMMPNGNMTGRGGCNSSFQSSLILLQPRSQSTYYLFTTDCIENQSTGGLRYNIIDMNADGGLGDVVSAGNLITTPVDESLTAVQHANGVDYWVIAHKIMTDSFFVYHLGPQGIVGVVKTKIGLVTPQYAGSLAVSSNGQKICYSGLNWTSVFDFDNNTGKLTNHVNLGTPSYSSVFSPNCRYVYIANGVGKKIYQFDVISARPATTKVEVGTTVSTGIGGMQLGPDGKIYVARFVTSPYLGVINEPNLKGAACGYVDNGIHLGGKMGKGGLPNYPSGLVGGCIDYPVENTSNYVRREIRVMVDRLASNNITINWTDFDASPQYRVIYRPKGSNEWNATTVDMQMATLEDLDPETTYEIRVLPQDNVNPEYTPLTCHFYSDDIKGYKLGEDEGSITATTTSPFDFDLYPNPANTTANVAVNLGELTSDLTIRIVDAKGQVVSTTTDQGISGYNRYPVAIENLSNGIYNVLVETASTSEVKKLVIMK